MTLFFSFMISMLITMALIPLLMRSAERLQFVDMPGPRKVHDRKIPRVGGIAMAVGAVLPIAMWLTPHREVTGFLMGLAVIVVFGVWDDRFNLNHRVKFLGQIVAVLTVMAYGGVYIRHVPLLTGADVLPFYLSFPITFLFLLGITNAINLSDGLDGLAGGMSLLSVGAIAFLGYTTGNVVVVLIAVAMIGSILGFLRFNTHPAQIFMGDGGSQFLGYSAGVLSVLLTQHGEQRLSPALPLLLLGLPILDTAMVMWQRLRDGRSPFKADKNHIHHKLLAIGFSHREAVLLIYMTQAVLVIMAYLMRDRSGGAILAAFAAFAATLFGLFRWASARGLRLSEGQLLGARYPRLRRGVRRLREEGYPLRTVCVLAAVVMSGYLLTGVLTAAGVTMDIGVLALAVLALMVVQSLRRGTRAVNWTDQLGLYVLATLTIFLAETASEVLPALQLWVNGAFVLLAVGVVVGFGLSNHQNFTLTTLDFLVIFAAFTIPNLPHVTIGQAGLGESVAKLIILFYATELMMLNTPRYVLAMRPLVMVLFLVIGFRAGF